MHFPAFFLLLLTASSLLRMSSRAHSEVSLGAYLGFIHKTTDFENCFVYSMWDTILSEADEKMFVSFSPGFQKIIFSTKTVVFVFFSKSSNPKLSQQSSH